METKQFDLGDVLSITTGRLVSARHIDGVFDILNWMTRDNLFTIQLPRARDECRPWLLRWFPDLMGIDCDELGLPGCIERDGPENGCAWFIREVSKLRGLPMQMDIPRIPQHDHERKDPCDELVAIRGTDEGIIPVILPDADAT